VNSAVNIYVKWDVGSMNRLVLHSATEEHALLQDLAALWAVSVHCCWKITTSTA
jgi:hypothetical protein